MEHLDKANSYGWVSIALHWISALLIIVIWFLGDSIQASDVFLGSGKASTSHIGLAVGVYLLFLSRIVWRLFSGHPWLTNQSKTAHIVSSLVHYSMLAALMVMLLTGPLLAWTSNIPLSFFGLFIIPSPFEPSLKLAEYFRQVHNLSGNCLIMAAIVHMCGACKHLMFNDDETFIRMIVPKRKDK